MKSLFQAQVARLRNYEISYLEILEPGRTFLVENPFEEWTAEQLDDFLYALERDDDEELYQALGDFWADPHSSAFPELRQRLLALARQSLHSESPPDRRWHFVQQLGRANRYDEEVEELLLHLLEDSHEYVRRGALLAMARIRSPETEYHAIRAWEREDEMQEHSRWAALDALQETGSPRYDEFLKLAAESSYQYLGRYARTQLPLPVSASFFGRLRPGSLPHSEIACRARMSERELVLVPQRFEVSNGVSLLTVYARLVGYWRDDLTSDLEPKYEVTLRSMRLHLGEVAHFWFRARQWLDLPIGEIATTAFKDCFYFGYESDILNLNFGPSFTQPHKTDWLKLEITYENRMGRGQESFELDRSCLQNFVDDWQRAAVGHTETATSVC